MILVTGGTGLLGLHIAMDLYLNSKSVRIISRKSTWPNHVDKVLKYNNINATDFKEKVEFYQGDVTDIINIEDAFEGVDTVYHCAGLVSFVSSDYDKMMHINVHGTSNVVNLCIDKGVKHLCHISSTSAIGKKGTEEIIVEDGEWVRELNTSNYAKSKFLAEREVWRGQEEGLQLTIVNPCVILGPGNWNDSSAVMFKEASKGLKFYTDGGNAFVDVRDVVKALHLLMSQKVVGERFLIIGHNVSFKSMFGLICDSFGSKAPRVRASKLMSAIARRIEGVMAWLGGRRPRITKETVAAAYSFNKFSNEKIIARTGIEFTPLEETVEYCVAFYKQAD